MKFNKLALLVGITLGLSGVANAQEIKDKEATENITKFITESGGVIQGIYETGITDFYEVVINPADVIYVNNKANKIFINGALVDVEKQINMTENRKEQVLAFPYKDLPKEGFITFGSGKKEITIFADPNCGFCKKYELQLENEKDLKIKLYPIAILSPKSAELNKNIMCSTNPAKTWRDWMIRSVVPPEVKDCKVNGVSNTVFSREKLINSTPTTIFKNGTRKSGVIPTDMLKEEIEERSK